VRELREPAARIDGYVYTEWYDGRPVVAVLPYRLTAARELEICLTDERVPCWEEDGLSAVTGAPQEPDPVDDAVRELREQTGYRVRPGWLLPLGSCRDSEASTTQYQLYAVDVTDLEPEDPAGDGSRQEAEAACVWIGLPQLPLARHVLAQHHGRPAAGPTSSPLRARSHRPGTPPWTAWLQAPAGGDRGE